MDWTPQAGDTVVLFSQDGASRRTVEDFGEMPELPAGSDAAAPRRFTIAAEAAAWRLPEYTGAEGGKLYARDIEEVLGTQGMAGRVAAMVAKRAQRLLSVSERCRILLSRPSSRPYSQLTLSQLLG